MICFSIFKNDIYDRTLLARWSFHKYKYLGGCEGKRAEVQVFRRKFHTYTYLDKTKVEFLSYIKIKNKKNNNI